MSYVNIELEFKFQDETTKKITYGPYQTDTAVTSTLASKIISANTEDSEYNWTDGIVNSNGSPLIPNSAENIYPNVPILNAAVITTDETDIDLRGA